MKLGMSKIGNNLKIFCKKVQKVFKNLCTNQKFRGIIYSRGG
nr:MAG TPA: hypothetical protein [Caudoviricetes sp.]